MPKTAAKKPAVKATKPAAKAAAPRRSSGRVPNLDQPLDLSGFKFSKGAKAELAAGMFKAGVAAFGLVGKVRK